MGAIRVFVFLHYIVFFIIANLIHLFLHLNNSLQKFSLFGHSHLFIFNQVSVN